jgi:hypothetical protein
MCGWKCCHFLRLWAHVSRGVTRRSPCAGQLRGWLGLTGCIAQPSAGGYTSLLATYAASGRWFGLVLATIDFSFAILGSHPYRPGSATFFNRYLMCKACCNFRACSLKHPQFWCGQVLQSLKTANPPQGWTMNYFLLKLWNHEYETLDNFELL